MKRFCTIRLAVLVAIFAGPAQWTRATPVTISGAQGPLAASVMFETVGSILRVTLTNTSTHDVLAPEDVLTAVFFSVTAPALPALTTVSAILGATSSVLFG